MAFLLLGTGSGDFSARDLGRAPAEAWGLAARMLPHQAQALAWIRSLAGRGLGSILADESGTGKVREKSRGSAGGVI